jgi:hypothetical protein
MKNSLVVFSPEVYPLATLCAVACNRMPGEQGPLRGARSFCQMSGAGWSALSDCVSAILCTLQSFGELRCRDVDLKAFQRSPAEMTDELHPPLSCPSSGIFGRKGYHRGVGGNEVAQSQERLAGRVFRA